MRMTLLRSNEGVEGLSESLERAHRGLLPSGIAFGTDLPLKSPEKAGRRVVSHKTRPNPSSTHRAQRCIKRKRRLATKPLTGVGLVVVDRAESAFSAPGLSLVFGFQAGENVTYR